MENQTDEILELDLESNDYLKTPIKNTSISVNSILDNKTVNIKNHKIIKIGVCDDRDFFILQYKHIFKDLNIKVQVGKFVYTFGFDICIEEKNGRDLISERKATDIKILFLDLDMPIMNGYETLEKIRLNDKGLYIVISTSMSSSKSVVDSVKLGADDFLSKPLNKDRITKSLINFLKGMLGDHDVKYIS